ncbi:MAG: RNA polymerase sigma factor [Gemmatimonadaceae bacterium]|nr:RNA polymerase sigma factor [Gemmatimonadaceae bacterium]
MSSDAAIVRLVLMGDQAAYAQLVDRHHARCLHAATHLLGDADDAEDAVQDAFVRAYTHLGSYREQDRFGAWLLRIVVNQCRTRAAKQSRQLRLQAFTSAPALNDQHDDDTAARDRRAEVAYALSQLPDEQREVIVLRFAEELRYDEIAAITGVGISALKMRVQRACTRLRALLAAHRHS